MLQIGLSLSNRWTELDLVVGLVVLDLELEVVWIVGSKVVWQFVVSDMGFCSLIWDLSFDFCVWFPRKHKQIWV